MRLNYSSTISCLILGLLTSLLIHSIPSYSEEPVECFPTPPKMIKSVTFWKKVYTEIDTEKGFIHDRENLDIIYEVYTLPKGEKSYQNKKIKNRINYYENQLKKLAENPTNNDPQLKKIASLWENKNPDSHTYQNASQNVRFQRGQSDKFLAGIKHSKVYLPEMKKILHQEGVPEDLIYLPHVESSFNCQARSKRGAVGIWQFLHDTGKRYMTINKLVDERKDPLISTRAAAKLLRHNYQKLHSWPLALIAYNYGTNGLMRATEHHNTNDFEYILDNYKKKSFSFATKNFYAEFLAAREVATHQGLYFSSMDDGKEYSEIKIVYLDDTTRVRNILNHYNMTSTEFLTHNPAITTTAIYRNHQLKKGFPIYLPKAKYLAIHKTASGKGTSLKD